VPAVVADVPEHRPTSHNIIKRLFESVIIGSYAVAVCAFTQFKEKTSGRTAARLKQHTTGERLALRCCLQK